MLKTENDMMKENLLIILGLENYGIRIENVDVDDQDGIYRCWFSVPEKSVMESEDQEMNKKIKTAEGLIGVAKRTMVEMAVRACKDSCMEVDEETKKTIEESYKFYAKVRNDETWNNEMGKARIAEIAADIKNAMAYSEV